MTDNLAGSDHRRILFRVRGYPDPYDQGDAPASAREPSRSWIDETARLWQQSGTTAGNVAVGLETARDQLFSSGSGWSGKAADEFRKKLDQVIWFAKEIAHRCDSQNPKPPPPQDDEQTFVAADEGSDTEGFRQLFTDLGGYVQGIQNDDKLPKPLWHEEGHTLKWWVSGITNGSIKYEIRRGSADGEILDIPAASSNDVGRDQMYDYYSDAGISGQTRTSEDGLYDCQVPDGDNNYDALFRTLQLNKDQQERCQETATGLIEKYGDVSGKFPQPAQAPQIGAGNPDPTGAGGGGGGGGGGGTPAFPSNPGSEDIPTTPDLPGDDGNDDRPDIPDTDDLPTDPDDLPTDTDGDGIPDSQDPFPNDPDHNNDGIPDGESLPGGGAGGGGGVDTGTETARFGGGGGGASVEVSVAPGAALVELVVARPACTARWDRAAVDCRPAPGRPVPGW